jgi:perosamine synthetase
MSNNKIASNFGSDLAGRIISAVYDVAGPTNSLHEPKFNGNELKYLKECIDSSYVSSVGKFVNEFEHALAEYTGAKFAIAVVNGTAALHIALKLAGVKPGDEVIAPALTFVATANAISYCGAKPHFVDSNLTTLGLDPEKLRQHLESSTELLNGCCTNKKTKKIIKAIVPMHTFGHPVKMDELMQVAKDFNLTVVEDAAESLGSFYKGQHTGTIGKLGALSFNGNKIVTTGGGGAILTNDPDLALMAKHLTTTAKVPHAWRFDHDMVGYNYRMPNINAALGCAQLEQLPQFLRSKKRLFSKYFEAFKSIPEVDLMSEPEGCISNYWLHTILIKESSQKIQADILENATLVGLGLRPPWVLMHELKPYRLMPKSTLEVAEKVALSAINLPSGASLCSLGGF